MKPGDIDLADPDNVIRLGGPPVEYFEMLRREAPVYFNELRDENRTDPPVPMERGFWVLTKHADIVRASKDHAFFSSHRGGPVLWDIAGEQLAMQQAGMMGMDPPAHSRYRKLVSGPFTPRGVGKLEPIIRARAAEIVDAVAGKGRCDFVMDLSWDLPLTVMCEFMGIALEDRQKMFDWSTTVATPENGTVEERQTALQALAGYALALAQEKRVEPDDTLISRYANGEVEGEKLNDLEIAIFFTTLSIASHETTRNTSNQLMRLLSEHPEQRELLLEDLEGRLPNAIEEALRHSPPVMQFRRTMAADLELRGQKLREGDKVYLSYVSGNRDEEVFEDPARFDILRPNAKEHLAFGSGNHFCMGAALARMQLRVLFTEILTRLPDLRLGGEPERMRSLWFNGINRMEVEYTPA